MREYYFSYLLLFTCNTLQSQLLFTVIHVIIKYRIQKMRNYELIILLFIVHSLKIDIAVKEY